MRLGKEVFHILEHHEPIEQSRDPSLLQTSDNEMNKEKGLEEKLHTSERVVRSGKRECGI